MSRIGKKPIEIPQGVEVSLQGNVVTVKGPKGELKQRVHEEMQVNITDGYVTVVRPSEEKKHRALHGLTRSLVANMVEGVTKGFQRDLQINGVGYRASKQGSKLVLALGYSHPVEIDPGRDLEIDVPAPTRISVKGIDKQAVGQLAAEIRGKRPPEPYLGKGIRYEGEHVRRKAGKAGKAAK